MSDTVALVTRDKTEEIECSETLIELLETALEKAISGEYKSGALIMISREGGVKISNSKTSDIHMLVAGCSYLQSNMIDISTTVK